MEKLHADEHFIENDEKTSFWDFKSKYDFVDQWFLIDTPYPLLLITSAYLLFVLKLGPAYLKNRRPFDLKNVLLLYNIMQVGLSAWMFNLCLREISKVGLIQRSCLTETYESKLKLETYIYYYFSCKITELLDTIFFVLRKKQNQVTFLHVYHHTMMVWNGWYFLKYDPGYWMLFLGALNSFVHVIMYSYYGMSAFPSLQKYLWWKKYITTLQLTQFGLIIMQLSINLFVNECKPSKGTVFYTYFNLMLFIYLFSRFYKSAYSKKSNSKTVINNNINKLNKNHMHENGAKTRSVSSKKDGDYFSNGLKSNMDRAYKDTVDFPKNSRTKLKNSRT